MRRYRKDEIVFEDSLNDDWDRDLDIAEVPIGNRPLLYLGIALAAAACAVFARVATLNAHNGYYAARAEDNVAEYQASPAPRGIVYDRQGNILADNTTAFAAILNAREYIASASLASTTDALLQDALGIAPDEVHQAIASSSANDFAAPIVLNENLTSAELVAFRAADLPTITIQNDFLREYPKGPAFSSVLGYTGRPTADDLKTDSTLQSSDFVGKTGIEAFYDTTLRGAPGLKIQYRNARGQVLYQANQSASKEGDPIHLTIDGGFQNYFYARLQSGLASLGRTIGVGIAMNPSTGEILSLVNLPGYDNNVFLKTGTSTAVAAAATREITRLLTSSDKPLFDRAVNGYYNPGSTIKPLVGVAALAENVIDPTRSIFSPGYILVPNQFNSSTPTKYLDWRYQGSVNLASALAQSSDVYFYIVGGGSPASTPMLNDPSDYGIGGLGITRLYAWWQAFGLGKKTGIDMPGESTGFLPTPQWKQSHSGTRWLLGDTYNVSIGQGDLLLSPLQLLDYIAAIANGGNVPRPFLNAASTPVVAEDLTRYAQEISDVQKGMRAGVATPQGTAYQLHDLPFAACAKTGSAQVANNTQENALFVGYAPCNNPQVAILILIEHSKEGSLNAVPIAKDVLNWYYGNRILQ